MSDATRQDLTSPLRLRDVADPEQLKATAAHHVWPDVALSDVEMRDVSGKGGGRVFILTSASSRPARVVLKIKSLQASAGISTDRMESATAVFRAHRLLPETIHAGEDWSLEPFLGADVKQGFMSFDPERAPLPAVARLLARIHALPTDWYAPLRARTVARDPRLQPILEAAPHHAHCWCPWPLGLENGMVFMGGGFPNPAIAREVMERQVASGVFASFLSAEAFHPVSSAGRRVVTLHGDFKPDNVLLSPDGDLVPIDFEFTCVGPAAYEFGFGLIAYLGGWWGNPLQSRIEFVQVYLENSGLPADEQAARDLLLDAEINTICNPVGLLSNIYDAQVPLLRGAPHPTARGFDGCQTADAPTGPEVLDLLSAAVAELRGTPALVEATIEDGAVATLHSRKAGSEPLWRFLDDLQSKNMLRLFGIGPSAQ